MTDIHDNPEQIEKQEQIIGGSEIFSSSSSENMLRSSDSDFDSENDTKPVKSGENQQVMDVEDSSEKIEDYKELIKKLEDYKKKSNEIIEKINKEAEKGNNELAHKYALEHEKNDSKIKEYTDKLKQICIKQTENSCSLEVFNELKEYAKDDKILEMIIYNNMLNNPKLRKEDSDKIKDELEKIEKSYFSPIGLPINEDMKEEEKSIINNKREFLRCCIYNNSDKIDILKMKDKDLIKKGFELACKYKSPNIVKILLENEDIMNILSDKEFISNITIDLCQSKEDRSEIITLLLKFDKIREILESNKEKAQRLFNETITYGNNNILKSLVNNSDFLENIVISEDNVSNGSLVFWNLYRNNSKNFVEGNNEIIEIFLKNDKIRKKMIENGYLQGDSVQENLFDITIKNGHLDTVKLMLNYEDVKNVILEKKENREKIFAETCEQGDLKLLGTLFNYMEENKISKGEFLEKEENREKIFTEACKQGDVELLDILFSYMEKNKISKEGFIKSVIENSIKNNDIKTFKDVVSGLYKMKCKKLKIAEESFIKTKKSAEKSKIEQSGKEEILKATKESITKIREETIKINKIANDLNKVAKKVQKQKAKLSDKNFSKTLSDLAKDVISAFEGKEVSPRQPQ